MATIIVRNLDDQVQRALKQRAAAHGRSMEAEVREILAATVAGDRMLVDWIDAASAIGVELELPVRSLPRELDLS